MNNTALFLYYYSQQRRGLPVRSAVDAAHEQASAARLETCRSRRAMRSLLSGTHHVVPPPAAAVSIRAQL